MMLLYGFRLGADVVPADRPAPAGRHEQAAEHPYGRRFSRPVGSEKAEDLSLCHLEADLVHGNEAAEGAAEAVYVHGRIRVSASAVLNPSLRLFLSRHEGDKRVFEGRQDRPLPRHLDAREAMAATTASAASAFSETHVKPVPVGGHAPDAGDAGRDDPRLPPLGGEYLDHGEMEHSSSPPGAHP